MEQLANSVLDFIRAHEAWAVPIVLFLSFGESLAFVSLLLPATVILWGVGALIGASGINFWSIWLAAAIGAALGDWLSYWIGFHYHAQIERMWPLSKNPDLMPRAHKLFEKYGAPGVFIGRFFGPIRAIVPLVAGAAQMPSLPFQIANWTSAFVWATVTLAPGAIGVHWLKEWFGF